MDRKRDGTNLTKILANLSITLAPAVWAVKIFYNTVHEILKALYSTIISYSKYLESYGEGC